MRPRRLDAAHLTSAHTAPEVRITERELPALARAGLRVALIAARMDPPEGAAYPGRRVPDTGGRLGRMLLSAPRTAWAGWRSGATVLHVHDAELMPWVLPLRLLGRRLVMDVHEDLGSRLRDRHWIPGPLRMPVAALARAAEQLLLHGFHRIVLAEPEALPRYPARSRLVRNLPLRDELAPGPLPHAARPARFVHVGRISRSRGLATMLDATARLGPEMRLLLAGPFAPLTLRAEAEAHPAWPRIEAPGALSRTAVAEALRTARAGLVLFDDTRQYRATQPTKLWEAMAAGLPVIASDLPAIAEVVRMHRCGVLVPPGDFEAAARAMAGILSDPAEAEAMGARGRAAIEAGLDWEHESARLLTLYRELGVG